MNETGKTLKPTWTVVVRLTGGFPQKVNHKVYHDNYYTSIPLMVYLESKGIPSLGTVSRNLISNCKLPSDLHLKNESRGTTVDYGGEVQNCEISSLVWKGKKTIALHL